MDRAAGRVIPSQLGQWIGEANFLWHSKQYTDLQLGQKFPTHRSSTGSTISLRGIRSNDVPQVEHISVVTSSSLPLFSVFLLASSSAWILETSFRHNGDTVDRSNHPGILCKRLVCSWAKISSHNSRPGVRCPPVTERSGRLQPAKAMFDKGIKQLLEPGAGSNAAPAEWVRHTQDMVSVCRSPGSDCNKHVRTGCRRSRTIGRNQGNG